MVMPKQNIYSCRRNDLELPNFECIWIEVSIQHRKKKKKKKKKTRIGTFCKPSNAGPAILTMTEESIGLAYDMNIQNILITGDFNLDTLKETSNRKIADICQHFKLEQLITEPTHFTESSSSVLDLFFTSNKNSIIMSGIGESFLDKNVRYHCPIFCIL